MKNLLQTGTSPFFVIAGPCVLESRDTCLKIGRRLKAICGELGLPYIFKASFDKANRSAGSSFRGPGLVDGLVELAWIREELGVPVLTDVHEPQQAAAVAKVCDILQIPAFLARQTDLLVACAKTGKTINVKKGQFMAPAEMGNAVAKIKAAGNDQVMLTERGTFFGYNRLVNDFTGLAVMRELGAPVVFDITHSTQQPAGMGSQSGGSPQYAPLLARAAIAAGVDGLFLECHPEPPSAKSDAATVMALDAVEGVLRSCAAIATARGKV